MKKAVFLLACLLGTLLGVWAQADSERLGMALEYFQSQKYHESLLIFKDLDKRYRLNPRFRAYIGVCYYYEWDYENACKYLDATLPQLDAYAPHERSVYLFADAESHFQLRQYGQADTLFSRMLALCYANEKPDAHYRIGFCHLFTNDWKQAYDHFLTALALYERYRPEEKARIAQLRIMTNGLYGKFSVAVRDWKRVDKDWEDLYGNQFSPGQLAARPSIPAVPIHDWMPADGERTGSPAPLPEGTATRQDTISRPVEHDIDLSDIYKHQTEIKDTEPPTGETP